MFRLSLKALLVGKFLLLAFIAFWTVIALGLSGMSTDIYFLVTIFGAITDIQVYYFGNNNYFKFWLEHIMGLYC